MKHIDHQNIQYTGYRKSGRNGAGVSQDFHSGYRSWARIETPGAPRVWIGEVMSPLRNQLGGLGSVVISLSPSTPAGSGAEPRPTTHFWHIWGPQNTSGKENSVTLASSSVEKSTQSTIGDMAPLTPLWLRPCGGVRVLTATSASMAAHHNFGKSHAACFISGVL